MMFALTARPAALAFAALCAGSALITPDPARAFGDCRSAAYLAMFNETGPIADCAPIALNPLVLNGRSSAVRAFRVATATHGDDTAWIVQLNTVLDRISFAATALGPGLRVDKVSILLADHRNAAGDEAVAFPAGTLPPGECPVVLLKTAAPHSDEEAAYILAHEIFHCIQYATWPAAMAPQSALWWSEGSAEYFAGLVVPEADPQAALFAHYAQKSVERTITDPALAYENVVVFNWLHQQGGGDAVTAFLNAMPAADDALPALRRQLPLADWARFVETYTADQVTDPAGRAIPPGRPPFEIVIDRDTDTLHPRSDAYQTFRAALRVTRPGIYELSAPADPALRLGLRIGTGAWQPLPATVSGCRNAAPAVLYAATVSGPMTIALTYRRIGDCAPCDAVRTGDSCLVGTWTMTGGGPLEWLRANGMPADVRADISGMSIRLGRGGDYLAAPLAVILQAQGDGATVTGTAQTVGISGHWGAEDGVLHLCPLSGEISHETRMPEGPVMQGLQGPGGATQTAYRCAGDTLTTITEIPGLPPMETVYGRSPP